MPTDESTTAAVADAANLSEVFKAQEGFEARVGISISDLDLVQARPLQVMLRALAREHHDARLTPAMSPAIRELRDGEVRFFEQYDFTKMSEAAAFLIDVFKLLRLNKIEITISNPHQHHKPG